MVRRGIVYDSDGFEITESDVADGPKEGVCKSCGEECTAEIVDFGIGPYEYGSIRAVDVQLHEVSPCCEDDVIDKEEYEVDRDNDVERDQGS